MSAGSRPAHLTKAISVSLLAAASLLALAGRLTGMLDRQFLYFPEPLENLDWKQLSGLPLEDVFLTAPDGVALHAWWIVAANEPKAVMVWCHGNAGNISHRLEHLAALVKAGVSILIFDYRGYGRSAGQPSEQGLYTDAETAFQFLIHDRKIAPSRIVIYGESLGTAVAADLASRHSDVAGVILEAPFGSIQAAAKLLYGALPVHTLLQARFDVFARLKQIRRPLLVIHGDRDSILPISLGKAVYDAANEPKQWWIVSGADHNNTHIVGGEAYYQKILSFIRSLG